ncbi:MAG: hypothetical protein NC212_10450 [Staphylococcus sp.]|nr:hypothetical protein [Staphylococcus sp.]
MIRIFGGRPSAIYIIRCILSAILPAMLLGACSKGGGESLPVGVHRLDKALGSGAAIEPGSRTEDAARLLFRISGYGELNDSTLAAYRSNPSIYAHQGVVDSVWTDLRPLEKGLGRMKFNFVHLFPGRVFPEVYAIVSPFNQSVFTADSLLYLGLNHYLGEDYGPYGYFPDYIRVRKVPARVIPDIAEAIVRRDFPYVPESDYPTVLSRLLYEGAVAEAVMQLTGESEQTVLGYDDDEMEWLNANERQIWEKLISGKMLFSTDGQLAAMLVNAAPFTSPLTPDSPGMAGRFIGHRIVSSYLDRRAAGMPELLSPAFYEGQTTLADSGY